MKSRSWKSVLLLVGGALALAVAVVLALAARKPATFRIERRAMISAPPDAVFPHLDDFRRWASWSPWEKLDPSMQRTYEGPPSGVGSSYAWRGNSQAGEGKMTIVESLPGERLALRLEFMKPFPSTNTTIFTLAPKEGGTEVSWAMSGDNTFIGKVFSVFLDMDALIGKDFEQGLVDLKRASEGTGES